MTSSDSDQMKPTNFRILALWAAVMPLLTINLSYLIGIWQKHLPVCVPYISGCTAVSSTGRLPPESWVFKAGMLSAAVIIAIFWRRCAQFLAAGHPARVPVVALKGLSVIAAVSLTLYAVALGFPGEDLRFVRRIGINGFAVSSFLAQAVFLVSYRHLRSEATETLWRWLIVLSITLPALGIGAEIAKWAGVDRHTANRLAAWNAFVALSAYFALKAKLWRVHTAAGQSGSTSSGRAASPRS